MNEQPDYQVKAALETLPSFEVIGPSCLTTNKDGQAADDINRLWERFFELTSSQKLQTAGEPLIYAVYSDYQGDHTAPFRITIGYRVTDAAGQQSAALPDLHKVQIQAGEYGILAAAGPQPQSLFDTWTAIWSSDLNRNFETDFELYGPRFFESGLHEILVHIGLAP